jgi:hypothetical protein
LLLKRGPIDINEIIDGVKEIRIQENPFAAAQIEGEENFEVPAGQQEDTVTKKPENSNVDLIDPPPQSPEILELHRKFNLTNPGHMGEAVILPSNLPLEYQLEVNKSWEIFSINEFVSRLIPLYRDLPDTRPEFCRTVKYSENLPVTSVIMIFHNEPFTMIMRSVFAVLKRSPPHLLGEVLLVDDFSDHQELKAPLEEFIRPYRKIKLIRSPIRLGLIKARMFGCVNAQGPALVFMDAHIEVTDGWLEPLIDPLAINPNTSTIPVVDSLVRKLKIH